MSGGAIGPGEFAAGFVLLAATLGCAGAAAAVVLRRRLNHLRGAPRWIAFAVLGISATIAAHLLPLMLGLLTRGTVVVAAVGLLASARRLTASPETATPEATMPAREEPAPATVPPAGRLSWLLAGAGVLLTLGYWAGYLQVNATVHPIAVDALGFHLPGVFRYIQSASLWQTTQYLPGQAQGNYPQYGDLLLLAVVLPWHSAAFVRYVDPLLLALAAMSVYAIARELRAPAPTAALAATALVAIRPALGPALQDVLTDPAFLAGFGAGTLFLVRHRRTGRRSELTLAGLGLGLALGTKWYGLTDVSGLIVVWLGAGLLTRRRGHQLLSDLGWLAGTVLLTGGVWLLRNLILTGNPVFDYRVSLLGLTVFGAPPASLRASIGYSLSHYLADPGVLRRYVWPVFRSEFGLIGGLIVAGAGGSAVVAIGARLRGARRLDPRVPMLAVAALVLAGAYAITPYSAQGLAGAPVLLTANTRYGVPALLLAAPLLAYLAARLGRARVVLEVVLLAATVVALHRYLPSGGPRVALSVVAAAVAVAVATRPRARPWALGHARSALAVAGIALACAAALAYHYQRVLARRPFAPGDPTVDYVLAHAPAHARIALTGTWTAQGLTPVAPVFGPRLQNQVGYVGPFVEHRLEQYSAAGPFLAALRRGRYSLLIVGTGFPPRPDPLQERWARRAGFTPVAESPRLVLLRAPGA